MIVYLGFIIIFHCVHAYNVTITQDGPVVLGGTILLVADFYEDDGTRPTGWFAFQWRDDAFPDHTFVKETNLTTCKWNITFDADSFSPGFYEVEVQVKERIVVWFHRTSQRIKIEVNSVLTGSIDSSQNGSSIENKFLNSKNEVIHRVTLTPADFRFVNESTNIIKSYWFVDYSYVGSVLGLNFTYNYTNYGGKDVSVRTIVIVSKANATFNPDVSNMTNEVATKTKQKTTFSEVPPVNINSCEPSEPNTTVGCFNQTYSVKEPVENIRVSGHYAWLQHGEIVNLTVNCNGSSPFWHCVKILQGNYTPHHRESCLNPVQTPNCSIRTLHYFSIPGEYTLLFIIGNSVSRTVSPFGVNVYEVQKHAQLSVIIVPISCSVIAVILIVFGIAYYIQSKRRYMTVEVADFDFAQPSSDTEYKTVGERLRDAVSGAINRTQDYADDGAGTPGTSVWSPSRKYGSMQ